jgi:hypothetical protein
VDGRGADRGGVSPRDGVLSPGDRRGTGAEVACSGRFELRVLSLGIGGRCSGRSDTACVIARRKVPQRQRVKPASRRKQIRANGTRSV